MNPAIASRPNLGRSAADSIADLFRRVARMADGASPVGDDMRVDISETDHAYLVKAELPGVAKEDIRIRIDGSYVSISTTVRRETGRARKHEEERVLLHETHEGTWSRGLSLPHELADDGAQASLDNGVLSLTLPKRTPAAGKAIAIK
ncbi:MAG: Hsp20/alpha crystallin family protein [Burkholderiaceae bacterium]